MSTKERAASESVRLYPTGDAYIPGEPAVEREVSPKEAKVLLAYEPPAYTTTKPKAEGKAKAEPEAEPEATAEAPTAEEPEPQE